MVVLFFNLKFKFGTTLSSFWFIRHFLWETILHNEIELLLTWHLFSDNSHTLNDSCNISIHSGLHHQAAKQFTDIQQCMRKETSDKVNFSETDVVL